MTMATMGDNGDVLHCHPMLREKIMRKIFEKITAVVLTVCVAFQFQVPTFAASEEKQYVSDIIVSYGEGDSAEADAKDWLTSNGYTVIDTNLNAGAEASTASSSTWSWATGARSARAVYLGYKTTTDSSQAITSLKTMNMTGSYSFDSYQEVLDQMADEIKAFMDDFEVTIKEWRENYKAGRGKAIEAYYLLNLMYDPDCNNTKMGDLLLNETKEEMGDAAYNKLSDEEKLEHADMTTILMQGNSDATKYMEQILAMGADTDTEKTWIDRLSEMGTYDDMMDALEQEAEDKNETFLPSEAAAELANKYDSTAEVLAYDITQLQEYFKEYINSGTSLQDDEDKIDSFIEKNASIENSDVQTWINMGTLYESLAAYKYPTAENPDGTLQDFFMESFDPDDADSRSLLYPMAAALSDGQRSAVEFIALSELITQGIITDAEALETANGFKEFLDNNDSISVFNGVDRSIFDSSSTALTSSARELQNSSQKSYTEGMFGTAFSLQTVVLASVFAVCSVATLACGITTGVLRHATAPKRAYDGLVNKIANDMAKKYGWTADMYEGSATLEADRILKYTTGSSADQTAVEYCRGYEAAVEYEHDFSAINSKATILKGFQIATIVLVVATIAIGVWTVISGINDLKAYYNRNMDLYPIPDNIVDEAESEDGSKTYTYYKAVKCNRVEKGLTQDREALEDNADLNGDLGKEWLALYYTKDASAGNPIVVSDLSGFKVITGSDSTPEGMKALTLFDMESPVNLTNADWVWNDETNGLYLYYTEDSGSSAASIFSGPDQWIVYVAAGVVIAAVFFLGGLFVGKRRKERRPETA